MTEPAPSHGERTMRCPQCELTNSVRRISHNPPNYLCHFCGHEWQESGATEDGIGILKNVIADLKQRLSVATSAREQAEAACGEMRGALQGVYEFSLLVEERGTPLSLVKRAKKANDKAQAALSSGPGKSTADELRRLRELLAEVYRQAGNGAAPTRRHALTPGLRDSIRDVIYPKQGE